MNTTTPRTDDGGRYCSHQRRERWIKTVPLKTSEELERELAAVTEQRDQYKNALQSADNHNHEIATKLEIVTEQRDRMAEALRGAVSLAVNEPEFLIGYFLSEDAPVREALQSLNQH